VIVTPQIEIVTSVGVP